MTTGNAPRLGNLLANLPSTAEGEVFEPLVSSQGLKIERIVSGGQASPPDHWYDQEQHEWVMVVSGRAGLEIAGRDGVVELGPGDWIELPAHCRHRVAWTSEDEPTVWLAVHYG